MLNVLNSGHHFPVLRPTHKLLMKTQMLLFYGFSKYSKECFTFGVLFLLYKIKIQNYWSKISK